MRNGAFPYAFTKILQKGESGNSHRLFSDKEVFMKGMKNLIMTVKTKLRRRNLPDRQNVYGVARVASVLCAAALLTVSVSAYGIRDVSGAYPVSVTYDGEEAFAGRCAVINDRTYVPFREILEMLGAEVSWDEATKTAYADIDGGVLISVTSGGRSISRNSETQTFDTDVLNISGRLYVPIRAISWALGLDVEWDSTTHTAALTSSNETEPETAQESVKAETEKISANSGSSAETSVAYETSATYSENDLYWLSRIIYAEAGGESYKGQLAVGSVVMNRVRSSEFPNTVYGVIFDRKGGTQFSPVSSGTIYNTPSQSAVNAAKACLSGYSVSDSVLFFMNPKIATSSWISRNRTYAFSIGNHDFYS